MSDVGKKWIKSFIIGIIVTVTGSTGIGALVSGAADVASGTPISTVVKDIAVDTAKDSIKDAALTALYGEKGTEDSVSTMFDRNKYKYVSDKKSGPIGYLAPGWYAEVYRIESDAYIGNRKYNKANGINMKWNMVNATDFEIGNFKKNTAYSDSYVAYNSETFKLVFSELHKGKLNGFTLVYDEYYNNYELIEYKKGKETGYKISEIDGKICYIKDGKELAVYDENKQSFGKISGFGSKEPSVEIIKKDNEIEFKFDGYSYKLFSGQDYLEYKSDVINFRGNAFGFECDYKYKNDESVTYTFETMHRLKIECTDGTIGEILVVEDGDNSKEAVTAKSISIALMKIGAHATVDVLIEGDLALLDTAVEIATGTSISDTINYEIDKLIDDNFDVESSEVKEETTENTEETTENTEETIVDIVEDIIDGEDSEENEDPFDNAEIYEDEDGDKIYELPSGVKITFD